MALKKTIEWETFPVTEAYKAIKGLNISRDGEEWKGTVHSNVYKDSTKEKCLYGENPQTKISHESMCAILDIIYAEQKDNELNEGWVDC